MVPFVLALSRIAALLAFLLTLSAALTPSRAAEPGRAQRIVSMNPSLTAILLALDVRDRIVGVDDFSSQLQPSVASLPRVGGLYSPSLEAVVALRPDLIVLVPSAEQRDFRSRLETLEIPVLALNPVSFDDVLATIRTLGDRVGRSVSARERVKAIEATRADVQAAARERVSRSVVLVLQRDPLYVIGTGSFIDEMLESAGGRNLARRFAEPYPRVSLEWLIEAAPEVLLDASDPDGELALDYWSRWPSLPAVRDGRVVTLPRGVATLPGPYLDRGLVTLSEALHGSGDGMHSEP